MLVVNMIEYMKHYAMPQKHLNNQRKKMTLKYVDFNNLILIKFCAGRC